MQRRYLRSVGFCAFAWFAAFGAANTLAAESLTGPPVVDEATTALWRFREGQGDRTACETKAPAAVLKGVQWAPGRDDFAVATHSGHVSIPDDPALRPKEAFTVELWVKLVRSGGDLICKNGVYIIRLGGTMNVLVGVDDARWQSVPGRRQLPTGRWTHLAVTYDSATRMAKTYIDGVLDGQKKLDGDGPGFLNQRTSELRLGANDWRALGSEVEGKIAMVRISNVARTFEPLADATKKDAAATALPRGNLVPNGDFELGLLGWRLNGEGDATLLWGPDAENVASGRLSLHTLAGAEVGADLREPAPQDPLLSRPIAVRPGARYQLTAQMRSDAAGGNATLAVSPAGGSGGGRRGGRGGGAMSQNVDLKAEWKPVTLAIELPDDWTAPSLCVRIQHSPKSRLWVDDVRLVADDGPAEKTLQEKIGVAPKGIRTGNLFFAGQKEAAPLEIVNADAKPHRVAVKALVVDWDGNPLPPVEVGAFDVPAGGARQAALPIDTNRRGTFRLGFELQSEGLSWRQLAEMKYAVIVPLMGVGDAEGSAFAMNTHMEREPSAHLARNMEVLAQCGVKWIRGWWGWGMCEKKQGTYDWNEFDRQLAAVEGAKMRIMPILLRYYSQYELEWAGPVSRTSNAIQEFPYEKALPAWSAFVENLARRYQGRISAYEIWNEPTMGSSPHGVLKPEQYAALLNHSSPAIRKVDPKATIVGFAGVESEYMEKVLKLGVAPLIDVVSEHSYSQIEQPELNLPKQTATIRAIMAEHGGVKPIWHTEQGVRGDDDGYLPPSNSEGEVAGLYTRNMVTLLSLGIEKYFWFSAQTSPTYGWAVFYEDYIPRGRMTALNACAEFLDGAKFQKSYRLGTNACAHLFQGDRPACVVWNLFLPAGLFVPAPPASLKAFDLMGNPVSTTPGKGGAWIELPMERPVYLQCKAEDYAALERSMAGAKATDLDAVKVTVRPAAGGLEVTVANQLSCPQDGVVEIAPATDSAAAEWTVVHHFHSLPARESRTFAVTAPAGVKPEMIRVRVGDRGFQEIKPH